jgi:small conductance mechanosensitive channel
MPETPLALALAVVLAFVAASAAVRLARFLVQRALNTLDVAGAEDRAALDARARHLTRSLTLLVYAVAAVVSVSVGLSRFGIGDPRSDPRLLLQWLLSHGVNLAIIVIGASIVVRAGHLLIAHLQHRLARRQTQADLEWQRRAATLAGILTNIVTASVAFVAGLMVLRELSIDVLPILTGAGIAGLAIGFGAQNLVRDVISGFFLILEDQVRVGDIARINGVGGVVEQINLRTIVLRDGEGAVQVFPNGTVTTLANLSKQFAYALVDVKVGYGENLDRVMATIREVGTSMEADDKWGRLVLAPVEVLGVESLENGFATIRVRYRTAPLNQGSIANELRRRLLGAFVRRGIRPYA